MSEPIRQDTLDYGGTMSIVPEPAPDATLEDKTILRLARLMEGGKEDEDTTKELNVLTKMLTDDSSPETRSSEPHKPLWEMLDADSVEMMLGYLDMRQSAIVRGHAILTISAYLKAADQKGVDYLTEFFNVRVRKGTYDDLIVAFSVAASLFPILPEVIASLFLTDGFVNSIGPLMKRKWKSRKVEQAALELVNAACMNTACREAIQKYCTEWLEEIVQTTPEMPTDVMSPGGTIVVEDGSIQQRIHSQLVRNLAAVILAKIQVVPPTPTPGNGERVQPVTTSIEDLAEMFKALLSTPASQQSSIEGLAYASLRPEVKEKLASDKIFIGDLVQALKEAPPKSPTTYGALTILVNLTAYTPTLSEEQKRVAELKAYANASKPPSSLNPLNDDDHVTARCSSVFAAGVVPVLVTHSQHSSPSSLTHVTNIIFSLSRTPSLRGPLAQQGAIKLLLLTYTHLTSTSPSHPALHTTAHALARILISTNPLHTFGGSNPLSLTTCIRPLLSLLTPSPTSDPTSPTLLPTFESLLALTNLCSTPTDHSQARNPILRSPHFPTIETDLLLSPNPLISRAATELLCNLLQSPLALKKYCDISAQASQRINILLALADAEDQATRSAAGGALAAITETEGGVAAVLGMGGGRGVRVVLGLCKEEGEGEGEEGLRHRGVVCVLNLIMSEGELGARGRKLVRERGAVEVLKGCLKRSRGREVVEVAGEGLRILLLDEREAGWVVKR